MRERVSLRWRWISRPWGDWQTAITGKPAPTGDFINLKT